MTIGYPILYTFRRCPHAIKARLALMYSQVKFIWREVSLKDKPNEMFLITKHPTVPLLLFDNGCFLKESNDIVNWSLNLNDPLDLLYKHRESTIDEVDFISDFIPELQDAVSRYKYYNKEEGLLESEAIIALHCFFDQIESMLIKNKYIIGNYLSYIDIILFPYIRQAKVNNREVFARWNYPKIKQWIAYFEGLSFFQLSMLKYPIWSSEQRPIIING
jgi:glutathione S-transferase